MRDHLPRLQHLVNYLQQLPYLATKNVYRVAHHLLEMPQDRFKQFIMTLEAAHAHTVKCEQCCAWKEREQPCYWCTSSRRNSTIVCVVETWHDLCAVERAGGYLGQYHVLGGVICPLDGVGPEDLSIDLLTQRIQVGTIQEIILALNQTLEGEATAVFIARRLEPLRGTIKVTCLSRGVPVGSSLDAMDRLTIGKALAERRPIS